MLTHSRRNTSSAPSLLCFVLCCAVQVLEQVPCSDLQTLYLPLSVYFVFVLWGGGRCGRVVIGNT